jgi:hypothetical protein
MSARAMALLTAVVLALALAGAGAAAQSGGRFDLSWNCVGCSGGVSAGGRYVLFGSAGQPFVGDPMAGGPYMLEGGFLAAGADSRTYLPMAAGRR